MDRSNTVSASIQLLVHATANEGCYACCGCAVFYRNVSNTNCYEYGSPTDVKTIPAGAFASTTVLNVCEVWDFRHDMIRLCAFFVVFQMMFATISPLLVTGAYAERVGGRVSLAFSALWSLFVYVSDVLNGLLECCLTVACTSTVSGCAFDLGWWLA